MDVIGARELEIQPALRRAAATATLGKYEWHI